MAGISKTHIMRIPFERTVITDGDIAENVPSHERIVELERTVLHLFSVQAAVCRKVYVLEEKAIHGTRNRNSFLSCINCHNVVLSGCTQGR